MHNPLDRPLSRTAAPFPHIAIRFIPPALCLSLFALLMLAGGLTQAQKPPKGTKNSSAASKQRVKRGQSLYEKNCVACHGPNAAGDDAPSLHGLKMSDQYISKTIKNGITGQMPAFGAKLKSDDIKALIAYLRSFKK